MVSEHRKRSDESSRWMGGKPRSGGQAIELGCLGGIAPVRKSQRQKLNNSYAQNSYASSFHEFAGHSIRPCPWAKTLYAEQRLHGKGRHAAVRSVAFKWIRILFACWKHRSAYDSARYLKALQSRGSQYAKFAD